MANSKHVAIRAAAAATLAGMTTTVDAGVKQNRDLALATGRHKAIHINLRRTTPTDTVIYTDHPRDWETEIELVFLARKLGEVEAADVADALWVQAYGLLMADQTLGGLVEEIYPGEASWDDAEGDTSLCRLYWSFTAKHRTTNNTIS